MYKCFVNAVDTHTEGDPTRFILSGVKEIKGSTMVDKLNYFKDNYDEIRKTIMQEPRGHIDMFGAILTAPTSEDTDFGIIFMDNDGYLNMCGHGIIAAATVAKKLGLIDINRERVKVDTPAGIVNADFVPTQGGNFDVMIVSVPSFTYELNKIIELSNGKKVPIDIGFGGSFFAFANAKDIGIDNDNFTVEEIRNIGMDIKKAVNNQIKVIHPEMPHINSVDLVEILFEPNTPEVNCKNILIYGDGQIGRDPCATGATAKVAVEYSKNKLDINEEYIVEGLINTKYKCKINSITTVGKYTAVIPSLIGHAYITAYHQFVVENDDPKPEGWLI